MKYKAGDEVLVKSLDWYYQNRDRMEQVACGNACFIRSMTKLCEKKVTISSILPIIEVYHIKEDDGTFNWTDEMFEGLVEEESYDFLKTDKSNLPSLNDFMDMLNNEIKLPDGYIFKDENGNIIDTSKIVLEKKEKKYPKTYKECCEILGVDSDNFLAITNCYEGEVETTDYERVLLSKFASLWGLRICRDAYWKIAGEEMGLGKPWEYDCNSEDFTPAIIYRSGCIQKVEVQYRNAMLAFPTLEMRDAFYENFEELIIICKKLL